MTTAPREKLQEQKRYLLLEMFVLLLIISTLMTIQAAGADILEPNWTDIETLARKKNVNITDALYKLLEIFRQSMTSSNPAIGNITLDPFVTDHEEIDLKLKFIDGPFKLILKGDLENVTARGLSEFQVGYIRHDFNSIDFGLKLPQFHVEGNYYFNGDMENFLHIYGKGPFWAYFWNSNINGRLTFGVRSRQMFLFVKNCTFFFSLKRLQAQLDGFFGGGHLGQIMTDAFSELGAEMVDQLNPDLSTLVGQLVASVFNEVLEGVTLKDIWDFINSLP